MKKGLYKTAWPLLPILIFAVFLRLYFFTGLNCSDDCIYISSVGDILNGNFKPSWFMAQRLMLLYPMALFAKIFGVNELSLSLYMILSSLGLIVLAYSIGRMFGSNAAGLWAAFLTSFYPLDIIYGTRLMPDIPLAFWMGLSAYFFFKAEKIKSDPHRSHLSYLCLFISGALVGISYLVKPIGLFMILVYIGLIVYKRKWDKGYIALALGFLFVLFIEGVFYQVEFGDFFYRQKSIYRRYSPGDYGKGTRLIDAFVFYPTLMLNCCFHLSGGSLPYPENIAGYFYYLIFPAMAYIIVKKKRECYPLMIWFAALYLTMSFGTTSFTSYKVIGKESRYMAVFSLPTFVMVGFLFNDIFSSRMRWLKLIIILATVILIISSIQIAAEISDELNWGYGECGIRRQNDIRSIYRYLSGLPPKDIYVPDTIYGDISFYFGFKRSDRIHLLKQERAEEISDAYIVLNASSLEAKDPNWRVQFFPFYDSISGGLPKDWVLLYVVPGKEGNLDRDYNPKIYYAPPKTR